MKVHAHETNTTPRIRGYTRNKSAKALRKTIVLTQDNLTIRPEDWHYVGQMTLPDAALGPGAKFANSIREKGFCIARLPPKNKDFYVFELALDVADLRIYSSDPDLKNFKEFRNRMELSPQGRCLSGDEPKLKGRLKIDDATVATGLGLNYDRLQFEEFDVVIVGERSYEESLRRLLERHLKEELPAELEGTGVRLEGLQITSLRVQEDNREESRVVKSPTSESEKSPSVLNVNIHNAASSVAQGRDGTERQNGLLDSRVVKLIGLIAAIVTLYFAWKAN